MRKFTTLLITLVGVSTFAAKLNHPNCGEILSVKDKLAPEYVAIVEGYNAKKGGEEVDVDRIVSESSQVKHECLKEHNKPMESVQKSLAKPASSVGLLSKLNLVAASCEEFTALSDEYQPIAAFWVAGHNRSAKLLRNGEVSEEFLARPVQPLVEECKAHPKASFYAKAKNWLSKSM